MVPGAFTLSNFGELCTSVDFDLNIDQCRSATTMLSLNFAGEENDPNWPTGCFRAGASTLVYFNKYSDRKINIKARMICKRNGTGNTKLHCSDSSLIKKKY